MAEVPQIVRSRLAVQAHAARALVHPEADLLTAYCEQALSGREHEQVLLHLAACRDCRDVVALAAPELVVQPAAAQPVFEPAPARRWFPVLRWGAVAAVAVMTVGGVTLYRHQSARNIASTGGVVLAPPVPAKNSAVTTPPAEQPPVTASTTAAETTAPTPAAETKSEQPQPSTVASTRETERQAAEPRAAESRSSSEADRAQVTTLAATTTAWTIDSSNDVKAKALMAAAQAPAVAPSPARTEVAAAAATAPDPAAAGSNNTPADFTGYMSNAGGLQQRSFLAQLPSLTLDEAEKVARGTAARHSPVTSFSSRKFSGSGFDHNVAVGSMAPSSVDAGATPTLGPTPRWSLTADGRLQRSIDERTWQPVTVAPGMSITSYASIGREVWVGGKGGVLYHSADGGATWNHIIPAEDMRVLRDDIVSINFTDREHGAIQSASGDFWHTIDGGQHWTVHKH